MSNNDMSESLTLYDTSQPVRLNTVPVVEYPKFRRMVIELMKDEASHCLNYYAFPYEGKLIFLCFIANDTEHGISILAHRDQGPLASITADCMALHVFEREIHENFGVLFDDHPWLKPLRYPYDRADRGKTMNNYPFYSIDSDELHEVGVGPVHAGVIEPGHFRFCCNGEKVLHLEIQLGYQHRGIEALMGVRTSGLKRTLLAENIAGDTVIGHSIAHGGVMEALSGLVLPAEIQTERAIALELERIAVHIGDSAALCADVAYQLGQVVYESLRTEVINTTQQWCGNRFGKGLVRPNGTRYPLTKGIAEAIKQNLGNVIGRFLPMSERLFSLPSVLERFDGTGSLTREAVIHIGAVGMTARMAKLKRDIRYSHPGPPYNSIAFDPVLMNTGDVMARALLRKEEVMSSFAMIGKWLEDFPFTETRQEIPVFDYPLAPESLAIHLTEAWRGEICHSAVTDKNGNIIHYKVKDPSLHNWMALALAVRGQENSDFPVCNKSFNLSYCGHDL